MDSLTQIALGAAVGVAVMGRHTPVARAAAWGAVAGTLPDLDVLLDHGDPILNMVLHRAESHALFWQALVSLPLGVLVARLHGQMALWRRWWLALALALLTHPLLDALTIYGTRLLLPFSDEPLGLGSVFIIDPLVTLPWLAGTAAAWWWARRDRWRTALRVNLLGLALGCATLGWGVVAQQQVRAVAQRSLAAQGVQADRVLVTPVAFSSLLWRVVAVSGDQVLEGTRALLDSPALMHFERYSRGTALDAELGAHPGAAHIRRFSHGFYRVHEEAGELRISDLRMGLAPHFSFSFAVATRPGPAQAWQPLATAQARGQRPDVGRALPWLWQRLQGQGPALPPPR